MNKLQNLWNRLPDDVKRVIHTFWQTFLAVFVLGITGILTALLRTHNISDAESAVVALVGASAAAGFSAVKGLLVTQ